MCLCLSTIEVSQGLAVALKNSVFKERNFFGIETDLNWTSILIPVHSECTHVCEWVVGDRAHGGSVCSGPAAVLSQEELQLVPR